MATLRIFINKVTNKAGISARLFLLICLLMSGCCFFSACNAPTTSIPKTKLVVFEAGSLMVPFARIEQEFEGLPIAYGLTIPNNSVNKEAAVRFIEFVIGPDGDRIFEECHHPPLTSAVVDDIDKAPSEIRTLLK